MPRGLADRSVRKIEPAEIDRQGVRVINLYEIVHEGKRAAGEPFIDRERGRVARSRSHIGPAERRGAKPPISVRQSANREVGKLIAKFDRINQRAATRQLVEQVNGFAILVQRKSQMNSRRAVRVIGK